MPGPVNAAMAERGCHVRLSLGAYLLGGLPAAETDAVRRHLGSCLACRAEYDGLAFLPPWLSLLSADDLPHASATAEGAETGDDPVSEAEPGGDPPA